MLVSFVGVVAGLVCEIAWLGLLGRGGLRGVVKGAALSAIGSVPGGARLYQTATRQWMGTQASHVDKLQRVWPDYVRAWSQLAGLELRLLDVWVHEGGWTPFHFLANYLTTAGAGVVTNHSGRMQDRYVERAIDGVRSCALPPGFVARERMSVLDRFSRSGGVAELLAAFGGELHEGVSFDSLPLESHSVDLCHSGGALEHHRPEELRKFLGEAWRILRAGGVMSHVFDHRDHLHHADPGRSFLAHLAIPESRYRLLCSSPLRYHNRLLPSQVAALFEEAGFERIAIRRLMLPDRIYVLSEVEAAAVGASGIARDRLASQFRGASEADLRTAAGHYIYQRPRS